MTYFTRAVEIPRTNKEGLEAFVQVIINQIEANDGRNAVLSAVDLLTAVRRGNYAEAVAELPAMKQ